MDRGVVRFGIVGLLCVSLCLQVPTACKACLCGFRFRKALASKAAPDSSTGMSVTLLVGQ